MSQAGIVSLTPSTSSNSVIYTTGVPVNMTVVGDTTLFTPTSDFFLIEILSRGLNVTGAGSGAHFNLGWTAPDYDDVSIGQNFGLSISATSQTSIIFMDDLNTPQILPSGLPFKINITDPSTFTTDVEVIYVIGFYI